MIDDSFALDLSIFYNSQIWKRTGNTQMGIAEPGSRVGLGWRLSFPYLVQGSTSYALVMPDGSSHEIQDYGSGAWKSVDSTYILLNPSSTPPEATLKGGTKLIFGNTVGSISYATEMRDRNGNQIFATYVAGTGNLDTITDTQGTVAARFYYTAGGLLQRIHSSGVVQGDINFTYVSAQNYIAFSLPSPFVAQLPGPDEWLLYGIELTNNGDRSLKQLFGYNQYGMLANVTNESIEYGYDQDNNKYQIGLSIQSLVGYTYCIKKSYDSLAMTPNWAPQIVVNQKTETVYNSQGNSTSYPWTINYTVDETKSNPSTVTVSGTDGISVYALNYTTSGNNWSDGLVQSSQRETSNGQTVLQTVSDLWTQDDVNKAFVLNPRITALTTTLDNGMSTEVDTTYTNDGTGNVRDVIQKGFNGAILKKTTTTYWHETYSDYTSKNLTNLVASISTKDASDNELARTETVYDDYTSIYSMADCPGVVSHSGSYGTSYTMRGNPTKVAQRYMEQGRMINSYMRYDIAGNVIRTRDPKGNETSTVYNNTYNVYGLPYSTTNALNQTTYTSWWISQGSDPPYYPFAWTGAVYTKIDANGVSNP